MDRSELIERHTRTLRAFVYRARRVEAHSIVQDPETLEGYATGRMTLELVGTSANLVQRLPLEENLESLAARVRPFLLQREATNNRRVTGALEYFAGNDAELKAAIHGLKTRWHRLRPDSKDLLGWSAQVAVSADAPIETMTDLQLAYAWLYGEVVHGDEARLAEAASFGLDERFRAATLLVGNAARLTVWTLNTLRNMRIRGLVQLDQSHFDEAVAIGSTEYRRPTEVRIGAPNSEAPPLGEPWGPEWQLIGLQAPASD